MIILRGPVILSRRIRHFPGRRGFSLRLAIPALAGLLASTNLWADPGTLEEIVVTGSRIARDTFSSTAPISVFDSRELMGSGVVKHYSEGGLRGPGNPGRIRTTEFDDAGNEAFPATGTNDRAGFIQGFSAYPEYKATLGAALQRQWGSLAWNARYIGAMDDFLRPAHLTDDALAEAIWYYDVFVQYQFGPRTGLTLGIDNIFDETPPRFHSAFNAETDPGTYDAIGRRPFATLSLCYGKCSR